MAAVGDGRLDELGRDLGLGRFRTFIHVTLPLSRQAILTGLLITVLPMLGDYYTNQMLSGAASTSIIGNLIQGQRDYFGGHTYLRTDKPGVFHNEWKEGGTEILQVEGKSRTH